MLVLMFLTSGILRESVNNKKIRFLRFRWTDGTSWKLDNNTGQCLHSFNREGQRSTTNTPNLTLEIEFVTAISGFRKGTLVNVALSVAAPWSADQEPVENSMSSSGNQSPG